MIQLQMNKIILRSFLFNNDCCLKRPKGKIFIVLVAVFFVLRFTNISMANGLINFEETSEYWPPFVRIETPLKKNGSEDAFRSGWRFITITYADGKIMADSGSDGIYSIAVEDTDFIEQCLAIQSGNKNKIMGNITLMLGNKLFDPNDPVKAYNYKRVAPINYYLFYYPSEDYTVSDTSFKTLFDVFEKSKDVDGVELVMFPGEIERSQLYENLETYNIPWTTVSFYFAAGYRKSLNHVPGRPANQMVLVDKDNKMIAHSDKVGNVEVLGKLKKLLVIEGAKSVQ